MCKNINHIPDFIGTEKFSNFTSFLGQECQFYAKGKVKCKYFSQFTKHPVINIEDYPLPLPIVNGNPKRHVLFTFVPLQKF